MKKSLFAPPVDLNGIGPAVTAPLVPGPLVGLPSGCGWDGCGKTDSAGTVHGCCYPDCVSSSLTIDRGGDAFSLRTLWLPDVSALRAGIDALHSAGLGFTRPQFVLVDALHSTIETIRVRGGLLHVGCEA